MRRLLGTHLQPVLLGLMGALAAHGLIVACGGRVQSEANAQSSGSRIKNIVTVSADGGRAASGFQFYDSKWGLECFLDTSEDGTTRCLPREGGTIWYSDDTCTREIVQHAEYYCGEAPKVMRVPVESGNGGPCEPARAGTVELGAEYKDAVYFRVGHECKLSDSEGWEYHEVQRYIPASEWVKMEKRPEE